MSRENVEVVRSVMAAWERGEGVPAVLVHDDVEWINPPEAVESGTRRGTDGFGAAEANFSTAFDSVRFVMEDVIELDDRVLVLTETIVRGRGSDVEVHRPLGFLWNLRGQKVARFEWFNDHEDALEAVGGGE